VPRSVSLRWLLPLLRDHQLCSFSASQQDSLYLRRGLESTLAVALHVPAIAACRSQVHSEVLCLQEGTDQTSEEQVAVVEEIATARCRHPDRLWELDADYGMGLLSASMASSGLLVVQHTALVVAAKLGSALAGWSRCLSPLFQTQHI
jgi:hypothetical protein